MLRRNSLKNKPVILAGDVGGTKTTLALFEHQDRPPLAEMTFRNEEYRDLSSLIASFLKATDGRPSAACFAVAGPVLGGKVRMTNLDWIVDGEELRHDFKLSEVYLINDLMATAVGTVRLPPDKLLVLQHGKEGATGNVAVIAPGTGLGEAFLVREEGRFIACATEGGHCGFAPGDEEQSALLAHLRKDMSFISVEDVCSGLGIGHLYDFFVACNPNGAGHLGFSQGDRTPLIVEAALASTTGDSPRCEPAVRALRMMVDILAAEAANLTLKTLATGGVYIGGGIPPRILPFFDNQRFSTIFCRGVYKEMLAAIPIRIILEPRTALLGAAHYGLSHIMGSATIPPSLTGEGM